MRRLFSLLGQGRTKSDQLFFEPTGPRFETTAALKVANNSLPFHGARGRIIPPDVSSSAEGSKHSKHHQEKKGFIL
ncbi:hypothetical protein NPIL_107361 [Nephila pilipes]|uniref:Uncharacterized protein n=1 Tax=Nephila pilipes TaxID=299642 RepID=A0A8X6NYD3_NEPPI|nr:hypothetical protein NPIL_107361 [Nephila pilipes]